MTLTGKVKSNQITWFSFYTCFTIRATRGRLFCTLPRIHLTSIQVPLSQQFYSNSLSLTSLGLASTHYQWLYSLTIESPNNTIPVLLQQHVNYTYLLYCLCMTVQPKWTDAILSCYWTGCMLSQTHTHTPTVVTLLHTPNHSAFIRMQQWTKSTTSNHQWLHPYCNNGEWWVITEASYITWLISCKDGSIHH